MSEADVVNAILRELNTGNVRLFRNERGGATYPSKDGKSYYVRFGLHPGASDLIGWKTIGRGVGKKAVKAIFVSLEVKSPKGRPTKQQTNWIEQVKSAGGIAGIVRSVEDARNLLGRG